MRWPVQPACRYVPSVPQQPRRRSASGTGIACTDAAAKCSKVPLASATNATLTLSNIQTANAGDYQLVVSNAVGKRMLERGLDSTVKAIEARG